MKRNKTYLIFCLGIFLAFTLIFTGSDFNDQPNPSLSSEYEHNYFTIKEKVQQKYALESRHIKFISRDQTDDIAFLLFTFMDEYSSYIGDLSYPVDSKEDTLIPPDKIISLNVHPVNDLDTPFTVKKSIITEGHKNYCYYYGWINNAHINDIDFAFSDQSISVETQGKKYYSLLRNKNQKPKKIAAYDFTHSIIHEFIY